MPIHWCGLTFSPVCTILIGAVIGYGYQVRFVEYGDLAQSPKEHADKELALNANMAVSMEWAYSEIR
jgi:xylulose-5-phosphate/fructose-6-phosphate phosphoketolase